MNKYKEIEQYVRQQHGFVPLSCWISHVMSDHGLTSRIAYNRISTETRVHPCPLDKRAAITSALRHFGMLSQEGKVE